MKKTALFGCALAASFSGLAQHAVTYDNQYDVSVFKFSHELRPAKRTDETSRAILKSALPGWFIATDAWTGGFTELNGPAVAVSGATLSDKAVNFMKGTLAPVGIKAEEWTLVNERQNPAGYSLLFFEQKVAGKKVAFAKMQMRFTQEGKLARVKMTGYGTPDLSLIPTITSAAALSKAFADVHETLDEQKADDNWVWFPIPTEKGYVLHPAFAFSGTAAATANRSIPLNIRGYVDGITGEVLYRDNEVKDAAEISVKGSIYTKGFVNPTEFVGLPYVTAKIGTAINLTNDTGYFNSGLAFPTTFTVSLEGKWSKVVDVPSKKVPAFSTVITVAGKVDSFTASAPSSSRHINAYYHVNTIHDFMKKQYGTTFTGLDYPLVTNVDATGTCNAYYTGAGGSSINFFPATPGACVSFAEVRDVVYHEYGHGIVDKLYSGGMTNGGLNEGQADVWSMCITKDSVLARGAMASSTSYIRRYDLTPKVYPVDLLGEVHADGEIIAGAWRDYAVNVRNVDTMAKLFTQTLLDEPDGPNGTEGKVYFEMLMDALVNDDDDGNLSNGTPHFVPLVRAFARHGIYLLQDATVVHSELAHQKAGTAINVAAKISLSHPEFLQKVNLVYRTARTGAAATWDTLTMVDAGSLDFRATIPAQVAGTIVDYFFDLQDLLTISGSYFPSNYFPATVIAENRSNLPYQFAVGVTPKEVVDFETVISPDWQVGLTSDNATSGKWIVAVPIPSYTSGSQVQTGADHTTGTGKCLVTGNAGSSFASASTASVKNGNTIVLSPMYNIGGYKNVIVEFYRWYGNDKGRNPKNDPWRAQMSSGSTIFYKDVDYTYQGDYSWRRRLFKPEEIFPGATQLQLRFWVRETPVSGNNGLVEAAVDDIVIYEGVEAGSAIKETAKTLANIFPNPASDVLYVTIPSDFSGELSMKFFDVNGKEVSTVPTDKGNKRIAINTQNLSAGQYFLVIEMDKTIQTHKVNIAH